MNNSTLFQESSILQKGITSTFGEVRSQTDGTPSNNFIISMWPLHNLFKCIPRFFTFSGLQFLNPYVRIKRKFLISKNTVSVFSSFVSSAIARQSYNLRGHFLFESVYQLLSSRFVCVCHNWPKLRFISLFQRFYHVCSFCFC